MSRPSAAFLDRDGTIIRDRGYVSDPADVELLPGAAEAISRLNGRAIPVLCVTNQSGIGRGLYTEEDFRAVQREVERQLALRGCALDAVYHCPHDAPDPCGCRKPALGLYRRAADRFGVALSRAVYVGDKVTDVLPARRTGGRGYLIRTGGPEERRLPAGCALVDDLWEAVGRVLDGEPAAVDTGAGGG